MAKPTHPPSIAHSPTLPTMAQPWPNHGPGWAMAYQCWINTMYYRKVSKCAWFPKYLPCQNTVQQSDPFIHILNVKDSY